MPAPDSVQKRFRRRRDRFIDALSTGRFLGHFRLQWIGPDLFAYEPDPADPFRYVRMDRNGNEIEIIQPEAMTTDGGSIPRIAQGLPGYSPWEYGPAYLIHDWEFEAHDRARRGEMDFDKSFEEVNRTLAEGILTLMRHGYLDYAKPAISKDHVFSIYNAVNSAIGRGIWDE